MASPEPPYRFEDAEGCSVVVLLPGLNESQWADIEKVGTDLIERLNSVPSPTFLVDLTPLDYMGSATVALIVRLWKSVKERDGRMVIVNQHELVFEVLKLAGLHQIWTIADSREQAMRELGVSPTAGKGIVTAPSGGGAVETGIGLPAVGILAVAAAVAGMILTNTETLPAKIGMAIEFGCAAVGLVLGTMSWAQGAGLRKNLGMGVMLGSLLVVVAGIVLMPGGEDGGGPRQATPDPSPQPADSEPADEEPETPEADGEANANAGDPLPIAQVDPASPQVSPVGRPGQKSASPAESQDDEDE